MYGARSLPCAVDSLRQLLEDFGMIVGPHHEQGIRVDGDVHRDGGMSQMVGSEGEDGPLYAVNLEEGEVCPIALALQDAG